MMFAIILVTIFATVGITSSLLHRAHCERQKECMRGDTQETIEVEVEEWVGFPVESYPVEIDSLSSDNDIAKSLT